MESNWAALRQTRLKRFGWHFLRGVAFAAIVGGLAAGPSVALGPIDDGPVSSTAQPFGAAAPRPRVSPPSASPVPPTVPASAAAAIAAPAPVAVAPPVAASASASVPVAPPVAAPAPVAVVPPAAVPALVAAQAVPPLAAEAPKPAFLLTLRGSNTIGLELAPRLAQAYLAYNGGSDVSIVRSKDDPDDASVVGSRGGKTEAIFISAHGSGFAAKGLLAHTAEQPTEIGMSSRRMTAAERDALKPKGDMFSAAGEHVLALDGVAVVVNAANAIGALSVQQLKEIFSGAITDWGDKRLGGTPGEIRIYARDANSGTFDTFNALVLRGAKLRPEAKRFEDSEALSAAVAKDPSGIGFIGLPYVGANKALAVSDIGTDPIRPNRLTVATENYALSRRLFLYTAPSNTNPDIQRFIEFALSKAGQALVEQVGFVALSLRSEPSQPPSGTAPEYLALIKNAERLSTDFRFRFNSSELDNRGLRDMSRMADYLATRRIEPRRIVLVGFGDNVGTPAAIKTVSENRARAVAAVLKQEGIVVGQIAGLGALQPVADNATEEGRDKNRRVEIYVR
jgi:phosphate transport system substrate-binding protein